MRLQSLFFFFLFLHNSVANLPYARLLDDSFVYSTNMSVPTSSEREDSSTFHYSEAYLVSSLGSEATGKNNFLKDLLK